MDYNLILLFLLLINLIVGVIYTLSPYIFSIVSNEKYYRTTFFSGVRYNIIENLITTLDYGIWFNKFSNEDLYYINGINTKIIKTSDKVRSYDCETIKEITDKINNLSKSDDKCDSDSIKQSCNSAKATSVVALIFNFMSILFLIYIIKYTDDTKSNKSHSKYSNLAILITLSLICYSSCFAIIGFDNPYEALCSSFNDIKKNNIQISFNMENGINYGISAIVFSIICLILSFILHYNNLSNKQILVNNILFGP